MSTPIRSDGHFYERFTNPDFGKSPKDWSGYFLQRYLLHGDLHLSDGLRVFAGLSSSLENGRNGSPRPVIDENRLDLHEAFMELARSGSAGPLLLRIGRQELALGSGRILLLREEPNVPLSFGGLRVRAQLAPWKIDVLALAPHVIEKVVCPQQRQVHGGARARSALLRLHHRARAGANLVGDLLLESHGQRSATGIAQASWLFSEAGLHEKRRDWTLPSERAQTPSCLRRCS